MSTTHEEVVVLPPWIEWQTIEDLTVALALELVEIFEPPQSLYEHVYESQAGEFLLRAIYDHYMEVWLLAIEGDEKRRVLKVKDQALEQTEGFSVADLEAVLDDRRGPERKFALRGLTATTSGTFDAKLFARVVAAFADDDADFRFTAVVCAARLGWPNFTEPLQKLLDAERDGEILTHIEATLLAIEKVHGR